MNLTNLTNLTNPANLATTTTLVAEVALALHPILLKQVNTNLPTQLLARLGSYSALSASFASSKEITEVWGSIPSTLKYIGFGLMNLVHISSSYISYKHLPAGSALALFYTYPFMNILASSLFLGEAMDWKTLPLMLVAFAGVLLIANATHDEEDSKEKSKEKSKEGFEETQGEKPKEKHNITLGVIMSLLSAFTETLIFMIAKTASAETQTPWGPILKLYPGALAALLAWTFGTGQSFDFSSKTWVPLLLFNVFVGFLGYSLRFFSIPLLSTSVFSLLTFIGVAAGYAWGLMYAKEIPSLSALAGAGLITGSLAFLKGKY